jgi:ABC-type nickel/cobalt efflux system permease component RcnA
VRTAAGAATALNSGILSTNNTVWMVVGAGMLLILAGIFWFFQQQRGNATAPASSRRRHSYSVQAKNAEIRTTPSGIVYCHQCGKRANSGDAFCRSCGVKLRTE